MGTAVKDIKKEQVAVTEEDNTFEFVSCDPTQLAENENLACNDFVAAVGLIPKQESVLDKLASKLGVTEDAVLNAKQVSTSAAISCESHNVLENRHKYDKVIRTSKRKAKKPPTEVVVDENELVSTNRLEVEEVSDEARQLVLHDKQMDKDAAVNHTRINKKKGKKKDASSGCGKTNGGSASFVIVLKESGSSKRPVRNAGVPKKYEDGIKSLGLGKTAAKRKYRKRKVDDDDNDDDDDDDVDYDYKVHRIPINKVKKEVDRDSNRCGICNKEFPDKDSMLSHAEEHPENEQICCSVCNDLVWRAELAEHLRDHMGQRRSSVKPKIILSLKEKGITEAFPCDKCDEIFASKSNLRKHKVDDHNLGGVMCKKCDLVFIRPSTLKMHNTKVHKTNSKLVARKKHVAKRALSRSDTSTTCDVCGKNFTKRGNMLEHKRGVHGQKDEPREYPCNLCSKSFWRSQGLVYHMMCVHSDERPFPCTECGKTFAHPKNLNDHLRRIHCHRAWIKCEDCNKGFANRKNLESHCRNIHNKDKAILCKPCNRWFKTEHGFKLHQMTHDTTDLTCTFCSRKFKLLKYLQRHMLYHTQEKRHQCETCGRRFFLKSSMRNHMILHTDLKPYTCGICQQSFKYRNSLVYHIRSHTGEKPYACYMCENSYRDHGNLALHIKSHTGERPFQCANCKSAFPTKDKLKKHIVKVHPV